MGTALFEKRHYSAIAGILKDMGAPRWVCEQMCEKLQGTNKYFKPKVFLDACGFEDIDVKKYMDNHKS